MRIRQHPGRDVRFPDVEASGDEEERERWIDPWPEHAGVDSLQESAIFIDRLVSVHIQTEAEST